MKRRLRIKCALCGKIIISEEGSDKQKVVEMIDGTSYTFDSNDCVLMFKKFRAVHGSDLFGNC
jgi:ribosomal protein L14